MQQDHYTGACGEAYYARRVGLRSDSVQQSRSRFFRDLCSDELTLLDFGCGSGGVAASLPAARRIGVEISEHAASDARKVLDEVHETLSPVAAGSVDVVISYHALEHVFDPGPTLAELRRVLTPGGVIRVLVPCEMPLIASFHRSWTAGDPNFHLFGWTPQTLGNLMTAAGLKVVASELIPASSGGKLAVVFGHAKWTKVFKALRSGQFHTSVTATRPTET